MVGFDVFRSGPVGSYGPTPSPGIRFRTSGTGAEDLRSAESCERLAADAEDLVLRDVPRCRPPFSRGRLEGAPYAVREGLLRGRHRNAPGDRSLA